MSRPWSSLSARLWVRLGDPRVLCDHAVAARCLGPIHSRVGGGEELVRRRAGQGRRQTTVSCEMRTA